MSNVNIVVNVCLLHLFLFGPWVWVDSGSWWSTGRPGMLWFMGSWRVGHDWATELNVSIYVPNITTLESDDNFIYIYEPSYGSFLFNLYAECIMQNAGLFEAQAGIKIARRNINKHRYADDTTLMAESEEELNSLLTKVKEENEKEWKRWLKTQQKDD